MTLVQAEGCITITFGVNTHGPPRMNLCYSYNGLTFAFTYSLTDLSLAVDTCQ